MALTLLLITSGRAGANGPPAGAVVEMPAAFADYPQRYMREGVRLGDADRVFWAIVWPDSGGLRPVAMQFPSGYCVPIFTSPFKANEYMVRHDDLPESMRLVAWNATRCAAVLQNLRSQRIESFAVDPASCTDSWIVLAIEPSLDGASLLVTWEAMRKVSLSVGRKHYGRLLEVVRTGDYGGATQDLDDMLRCVIPEEPRFSLLLGACGVGLGDSLIVGQALRNLSILDPACAEVLGRESADTCHGEVGVRRSAVKRILALLPRVRHPLL